ncbi:MAG: subtilisin-like proprotein convertase family protein [Lentimonas sp.]|jgi:subtilisin-like proprotein convertase family protein
MKLISLICFTIFSLSTAFSQGNLINVSAKKSTVNEVAQIKTKSALRLDVNQEGITNYFKSIPFIFDQNIALSNYTIDIPNPDGTFITFKVLRNTTMSQGLMDKFPEIITLDGIATTGSGDLAKIDVTPHGFHAMVYGPNNSTYFVDPTYKNKNTSHISYYKSDFETTKVFNCSTETEDLFKDDKNIPVKIYGTCELRTYRLALSATGEYSDFHGGTKALAQAAQVTTMNRVNGVYEKDMAITLTIIPNNNLIVYTDGTTDPFSNGNAMAMLDENINNTNSVIGIANYDIGHVFGTNSGGVAGLGVVCTTGKARGVTGSGFPVGDPFDIDYVAHEMGHQFGANHTQNNSCNRNGGTAMEPGSASTIMGYAGICSPNVQSNSDDHFHGVNLSEISTFIQGTGNCAVKTSLSNNAPAISGTNANISIPKSTPFALTCYAIDPDGDVLTYNWEQMNNQVSTQPPVATATGGPSFRSFSSSTDSTRYFPRLSAQANNGPFTWERLPSVARTMNFRVSVRDNARGGGCADFTDVTVTTVANAGPFVVLYPTATGITWTGLTSETVTWDAANTTAAPINATNVDIYLSTDNGSTYPTLLIANTPNDGAEQLTVPNTPASQARIMVISSQGTFFDISNNPFEIVNSTFDYFFDVDPLNIVACENIDTTIDITTTSIGGYEDSIDFTLTGLPGGMIGTFGQTRVKPGDATTLTFSNVPAGNHSIVVVGNSTTGTKTKTVSYKASQSTLSAINLLTPANASTGVSNPVKLIWNKGSGFGITYDVEVDIDGSFSSPVASANGIVDTFFTTPALDVATQYFWRVTANNACVSSTSSTIFDFTTENCLSFTSSDTPLTIETTANFTVESTINVPVTGFLTELTITNLKGTHSYVSDLTVSLVSPAGTQIILFDDICTTQDNFNINFDDAAASPTIACPPTDGLTYKPTSPFGALSNLDVQGNWILRITDNATQDGGSFDTWTLNLCITETQCNVSDQPVLEGPTSTCAGEDITLNLVSGDLNEGTEWQWYTASCGGTLAGTGTSITVQQSSTQTYYARGAGGCVVFAPCGSITVTTPAINTNVTQDQSTLTSVQSGGTYQWLNCNPYSVIPNETGQSFHPGSQMLGIYAVEVTVGGCKDTSVCTTINQAGLEEFDATNWNIYPNPTQSDLQVEWPKELTVSLIEIVDLQGKVVYQSQSITGNSHYLKLEKLSNAVYFLKAYNSEGILVFKVEKK